VARFWKVVKQVIVNENCYTNMCPIHDSNGVTDIQCPLHCP